MIALPRFSRQELLFSLKSFFAAMLAAYLSSRFGLPRPFWAMMTAYIVAYPLASNVRSKALYRFLGTLLGCAATVVLVPSLSGSPELLSLTLALWVGLCFYFSLLDRSARSYVFMLAGYSAALIGFPLVEAPAAMFGTALARVTEIGLGILCASVVHSTALPAGLGPSLLGVIDRALGDARRWLDDLLSRSCVCCPRMCLSTPRTCAGPRAPSRTCRTASPPSPHPVRGGGSPGSAAQRHRGRARRYGLGLRAACPLAGPARNNRGSGRRGVRAKT